jgi:hypothetical protein
VKNPMMILAVAAVALAASGAPAAAATSKLSLGLGQGTADLYSATGTYLAPSASPETNVNAEYWYAFSDDYAFALSGAYGMGRMEWKSGAGDPDVKATTASYKFRVGGDRMARVGERLTVFLGPGIEYWSGSSKLEVGGTEDESESVQRLGVSGRIGGFITLSPSVSIMGQVGHTFGYASVEDSGAETTWWPSSFQASWGVAFNFGGDAQ